MSSLNKIILVGRLASDPDIKATTSGDTLGRFTLIVERPRREDSVSTSSDYINCVAWRDLAGKLSTVSKDSLVLADGRIVTRSFEDDNGQRKYVTEVEVRDWHVLSGSAHSGQNQEASFSLETKASYGVEEDDFDFSKASPNGPLEQEPEFGKQEVEEDIPF